MEVEKSPVDNRSTKPEKMEILSCQKIKKNMKKARINTGFSRELEMGLEPTTYALRMRRSTD